MEYTLRINPKAQEDLQNIKMYIEIDNPSIAKKIILQILDKIDNLKKFPYMGKMLMYKIEVSTKYRYIIVDNYLVFYLIEGNIISINRVLHGTRDYKTLFINSVN